LLQFPIDDENKIIKTFEKNLLAANAAPPMFLDKWRAAADQNWLARRRRYNDVGAGL